MEKIYILHRVSCMIWLKQENKNNRKYRHIVNDLEEIRNGRKEWRQKDREIKRDRGSDRKTKNISKHLLFVSKTQQEISETGKNDRILKKKVYPQKDAEIR